ncbi:MAG: hypothetical protein AB1705_13070 [Verrucomicrobiota bacterium]
MDQSKKVKKAKLLPLSLRLSPELEGRLVECSHRLRMKKHTLAQEAIAAAVEAIEKNGYRLVVPVEFDVRHVPVTRSEAEQREEKPPTETRSQVPYEVIEHKPMKGDYRNPRPDVIPTEAERLAREAAEKAEYEAMHAAEQNLPPQSPPKDHPELLPPSPKKKK